MTCFVPCSLEKTTNEKLVTLVQSGRDNLILPLWEQVERFVAQQARKWAYAWRSRHIEVEDLVQSGFLAFIASIQTYDPEKGVRFLTWLGYHLKTAFSEAVGCRTDKQLHDPLHSASSLEAPLGGDDVDITLGDTIADPVDCIAAAERNVFLSQLHDELDRALSRLPEEQSSTLRQRFYHGMTLQQIADQTGELPSAVRRFESDGLKHLRRPGKENARLRSFLDERTPFYDVHGVHGLEWLVAKREHTADLYAKQNFR